MMEDEFKRNLLAYKAHYKLHSLRTSPAASRGRGKGKRRSPESNRVFQAAVDHALGMESGFPNMADQATKKQDGDFFRAAAEAMDALRRLRPSENKIRRHVRLALQIFLILQSKLRRLPTRNEIRHEIELLDPDSYCEAADWDHVWNEADLKYLECGHPIEPTVTRIRRTS